MNEAESRRNTPYTRDGDAQGTGGQRRRRRNRSRNKGLERETPRNNTNAAVTPSVLALAATRKLTASHRSHNEKTQHNENSTHSTRKNRRYAGNITKNKTRKTTKAHETAENHSTHNTSTLSNSKKQNSKKAYGVNTFTGTSRGKNNRNNFNSESRPRRASDRRSSETKNSRYAHKTGALSRNALRNPAANTMPIRTETSAGGLVVSGLAEAVRSDGSVDLDNIYVALIGRLDRRGRLLWSIPKGHVENNEPIDLTAEREVWEETGIHGQVFATLGVIDYWFVSEGTRIHKTVHHHLLRYVDGDLNDEDPEVTEVAWINANELVEHFAYADERKLARIAHELLPDFARAEKKAGRATPR
ncbi:NUDIX hydrolase [Corynebacterium kutscheri]|uniref:MutT/NUDIX family protein n=1 Tax=Corynebacterium kutscheri TaxID=35755 RepID=A0AB38VRF4_9CORY|nr:NUDIX hydrolase [Corynebacterium kutscheri]VEH05620.1 MutT/NUDIX family protein [Corynebacterium kutscheri]